MHENELNIPEVPKKRVVIIGGGFGGLKFAQKISKKKYQVVLLDRNNYHTFQPLLYQVATGGLEADSIAYPLRKAIRNNSVIFRLASTTAIHPQEHYIETSAGPLSYDFLVIASGSKSNYFGINTVEQYGFSMKSVTDALDIRSAFFQKLEEAVLKDNLKEFSIVIVGGGPTGVELAGALADLKKHVLPHDYPDLDISKIRIILLEAGPKLIGSMSSTASRNVDEDLRKINVEIITGKSLKEYAGNSITLNDSTVLHANMLIWAAGVSGNNIEGLKQEVLLKQERYNVDIYNRIVGYENIFAIGDVAAMIINNQPPHPMLAPVAIQQAGNLAANMNINDAREWRKFKYKDKGVMATIGRNKAVADIGKLRLHGFIAWIIWIFVHLMSLAGFRNRVVIFINWMWNYIKFDSAIRLIIRPVGVKKKEKVLVPVE